ncbi:MAG: mannonate dehydratase [Verrucomicrobiales bacterium]|jgi:mannonate dehydratase|nr:mannonate dehydratase [Verrucomicrobiales bacterium]
MMHDKLMEESFRWYGPGDPVPLAFIRQAGATAVFTALHEIPYGEPWPRAAIRARLDLLAGHGLRWTAVESVPVHEDLKTGRGDLRKLLDNYARTLAHLGAEGVRTVIYNFMPVLDWIRTDLDHELPDGSRCLLYNPAHFAAFELFALQRPGAAADYTARQRAAAKKFWDAMTAADRDRFTRGIIDVFPGCKLGLTVGDIRARLAPYAGMDAGGLRKNFIRFLEAVCPAAERAGVRLAVHPDDPPFPVLGLPRIVSRAADLDALFQAVDSPANGLCFCTGSLGANPDNDLPQMVNQYAARIHAAHLRSTRRLADGAFFEADHLAGGVDMPAVVRALLDEQDRRRRAGRADWRLAFRPDHGHVMMDDLQKDLTGANPGYTCIGRMRGLAELRGLMHGLRYPADGGKILRS